MRLKWNFIVKGRGLLLLVFLGYLLLGPVRNEADVVASVFGYSSLGILIVFAFLTFVHGRFIKKNLTLTLTADAMEFSQRGLVSGKPTRMVMKTSPLNILPLYVLQIELVFEGDSLNLNSHCLIGRSSEGRLLIEDIVFPHRGDWQLSNVKYQYGDQLGLTMLAWEQTKEELIFSCRVQPPLKLDTSLPVISSSARAGESLIDVTERQGEPFDLKPYHPSDGMRKVLWKVFARSGILLSRHPERSMTPEGQVIIFACAGPEDDKLCAEVMAYIRRLEELDLQVFFGCQGMRERPLARTANSAEALLTDSVWDAAKADDQQLRRDLETFLEEASTQLGEVKLQNLVFFCSPEAIGSDPHFDSLLKYSDDLQTKNIAPIFCIAGQDPKAPQFMNAEKVQTLTRVFNRFLYHQETKSRLFQPEQYSQWLKTCRSRGWEVMRA